MWEKVLLGGDLDSILRISLSAPLLYVAVVAFIRVSGKRSTSQMNNFDWIVTVAIGSLVGSGIIVQDIGALDAIWAIALLLGLQYALTWSILRSEGLANLVKASPRLLLYQGKFIETALRDERVSRREVMSAIRRQGLVKLSDVTAVVLETDASFSVLSTAHTGAPSEALRGVKGFP
jgi:uncharacterized membrane protein YcaP (DUF421 family)